MSLTTWFSLVAICYLGAMTPGPSLAVVLRQTIHNGRAHGVVAGISHAIGVAGWALLTVFGLALLVTKSPVVYRFITYGGAAYLAWLGYGALRSTGKTVMSVKEKKATLFEAARDGMAISLMNPKLAFFFIALFSQYVSSNMPLMDKAILTGTATFIDGFWYSLVAIVLSYSTVLNQLHKHEVIINRITGIVLIGLALRVITL